MPCFEPIRVFIGYDEREAAAYHVCAQSLIEHASRPLSITPLSLNHIAGVYRERHMDGSNAFIYSRFLVPYLCGFDNGWALYLDGDMLVRRDRADLWDLRDLYSGVQVVQHNYRTKFPIKYLGAKNPDYPHKNWSSVILGNCGHAPNKRLTPEFVAAQSGEYLHRFAWLAPERIGALPPEWNHLCMEYDERPDAAIYHYTVGLPAFRGYERQEGAQAWFETYRRTVRPMYTGDGT